MSTIRKLLPMALSIGMATVGPRVKNIISGISLMIASGFFVLLAVVFGLMSMFFALADMNNLITPSLVTGGVIILLAILTAIQGKRIMSKKSVRIKKVIS